MLRWKSESCDIEKFVEAYLKQDELVENLFKTNRWRPNRAYAALGRELGIPANHVRGFETAFKRRYLAMTESAVRAGRLAAAPRWAAAAEARLRVARRLAARADDVVRALRAAARLHGALCSGAMYERVARALRLAAPRAELHSAWVRMQLLSLRLLAAHARAGDAPVAAPARLHAHVADLVLLHTDLAANSLLTPESEAIFAEERALRWLVRLVRRHRADQRAPPAHASRMRAQRWTRVYNDYIQSFRLTSIVILQRRWHELKVLSVRALRSYWWRTRAQHDPVYAHAHGTIDPELPLPTPLQLEVLTEYPLIATRPLPRWRALVRQGEVITSPLSDIEYEAEQQPCGAALRRVRDSGDEDDEVPPRVKLKLNDGTEPASASTTSSTSANTPPSVLAGTCVSFQTASAHTTPNNMDFVSALQNLDPAERTTESFMDSDDNELVIDESELDIKPKIDDVTGEVIVKSEPGEPSRSGRSMADRIVFTDDDDSSIGFSDDSDDFDEDFVSSDSNFDEKILSEPRVLLTRVDDWPAWHLQGHRILQRHCADDTDSGRGATSPPGGTVSRKAPPYYMGIDDSESLPLYEEGPYPTLAKIQEMIAELSAMSLARELRPAGAEFCCAARRQRHESDARQRAGLPPQHPLDTLLLLAQTDPLPAHDCPSGATCQCCCPQLCPRTARTQEFAELNELQRIVTAMLPIRSWPRHETLDTQSLKLQSKSSTTATNAPKSNKKRKPRKKSQPTSDDVTPATTEASGDASNGYDEWIRQKNVNNLYFTVPGANNQNKNDSRTSKTNTKEENKNKPDIIAQTTEKTVVSTTSPTTTTTITTNTTTAVTETVTSTAIPSATATVITAATITTTTSTTTCLKSTPDLSARSVNKASKLVRLTPITAIYVPVSAVRQESITLTSAYNQTPIDDVICISDDETKVKEEPEQECSEPIETQIPHVTTVSTHVAPHAPSCQPFQYSPRIIFGNNEFIASKHDHTYSSAGLQNLKGALWPIAPRQTSPIVRTTHKLSMAPSPRPTYSAQDNATIDKQSQFNGAVKNDTDELCQVVSLHKNEVNSNVEQVGKVVAKTGVVVEREHVLQEKADISAAPAVHIPLSEQNSATSNLLPKTLNKKSHDITSNHSKAKPVVEQAKEKPTCPKLLITSVLKPISKDTVQAVKRNMRCKKKKALPINSAHNSEQKIDKTNAPHSTTDAASNACDYAEWVRQKNINLQYFQIGGGTQKPAVIKNTAIKSTRRKGFTKSSLPKQKDAISKKRSTVTEFNKKKKENVKRTSGQCDVKDKVPADEQVKGEISSKPSDDISLCSDALNQVQNKTIDSAHMQSEMPLHGSLLQSELRVHNAMVQNIIPPHCQPVNSAISFHSVPILSEKPVNSEPAKNKLLVHGKTTPSEIPQHKPVQYTANTNNTNSNYKNSQLTNLTNTVETNLTTLEDSLADSKLTHAVVKNPTNQHAASTKTLQSNGPLYIDIPNNTAVENELLPDFSDSEEEISSSRISENINKSLDTLEQPRIPTLIVGEYPSERTNKLKSPKNLEKFTAHTLSQFTGRISELSDPANICANKNFTSDGHIPFRQEISHKLAESSPSGDKVTQISPTAGNAQHLNGNIQNVKLASPLEVRFVGEYSSKPAPKKIVQCFDKISHSHSKTELTKLGDGATYEPPWRRPEPIPASKTVPVIEVFGSYPKSNNKDSSKNSVPRANAESIKSPPIPHDLLDKGSLERIDIDMNLSVSAEAADTNIDNSFEDLTSPITQCHSSNEREAEFLPPVRRVQRRTSDGIRKSSIFMVPSSSPGKNNIINVPEIKNNVILDNEELEPGYDNRALDPVKHISPTSPTNLTKQNLLASDKLVRRRNSDVQSAAPEKGKPVLCSPKKFHEVPVIPEPLVSGAMETKPKFKFNLNEVIKKIYTPVSLKSQAHKRYSQYCVTSGDTEPKKILLKDKLRTDWENNFFPTRKYRGRRKSVPSTTYSVRSSLPSPIPTAAPNQIDLISTAPPLRISNRRSSLVRINPWSGGNEIKEKAVLVRCNSTAKEPSSASHDHIGIYSGNAPIPKEPEAPALCQITPVVSPKLNTINKKLSQNVDKSDAAILPRNNDRSAVEKALPKPETLREKLESPTLLPQPLKIIKRRHSQVYIAPWSGPVVKSAISPDQDAERSSEVSAPKNTDTEVTKDTHSKNVHFNVTTEVGSKKVLKFPKRRKSLCDTDHRASTKIKKDSYRTLRRKSMDAERNNDTPTESLNQVPKKNVVSVPINSRLCKFIAAQKAMRDKYYEAPDSPAADLSKESATELQVEPSSPKSSDSSRSQIVAISHQRRSELRITIPEDDYDKMNSHKAKRPLSFDDAAEYLLAPSYTTNNELTEANISSLQHCPKKRNRKRRKSQSTSPVCDDVIPSKIKRYRVSKNKHRLDFSDAVGDTKHICIKGGREDLTTECAKEYDETEDKLPLLKHSSLFAPTGEAHVAKKTKNKHKINDINLKISKQRKLLSRRKRKKLAWQLKAIKSALKDLAGIVDVADQRETLNNNRINQRAPNSKDISKHKRTHKNNRAKHLKLKSCDIPEYKETNNNNITEHEQIQNTNVAEHKDSDDRIKLEYKETDDRDKLKHKKTNDRDKSKNNDNNNSDKLEHKETDVCDKLEHLETDNCNKLEHIETDVSNNLEREETTNFSNILEPKETYVNDKPEKKEINDSGKLEHKETADTEETAEAYSDKLEHKEADDNDKLKHKEAEDSDKHLHIKTEDSDKFENKEADVSEKLVHNVTDDIKKPEDNDVDESYKPDHNETYKVEHKETDDSDKFKYKETDMSKKIERNETETKDKFKHNETDDSVKFEHKETDSDEREHKETDDSSKVKHNETDNNDKLKHKENDDSDKLEHNETDSNDKLVLKVSYDNEKLAHKETKNNNKLKYKNTNNSGNPDLKEKYDSDVADDKKTDDREKLKKKANHDSDEYEQQDTDNNEILQYVDNYEGDVANNNEADENDKIGHRETNECSINDHKNSDDSEKVEHKEVDNDNLSYKETDDSDKLEHRDTNDTEKPEQIQNYHSDITDNKKTGDSESLEHKDIDDSDELDQKDTDESEKLQYIDNYDSDTAENIESCDSDVADNNETYDSDKLERREIHESYVNEHKDIDDRELPERKETNNNDLVEHKNSNIEKLDHKANNNVLPKHSEPNNSELSLHSHRVINDEVLVRIKNLLSNVFVRTERLSNEVLDDINDALEYRDGEEVAEHKWTNNNNLIPDVAIETGAGAAGDVAQQPPSDEDLADLSVPADVRSIPLPPLTDIPLPPMPAPRLPAECAPADIPLPNTPPPNPALYFSSTAQASVVPKKRIYVPLYEELSCLPPSK